MLLSKSHYSVKSVLVLLFLKSSDLFHTLNPDQCHISKCRHIFLFAKCFWLSWQLRQKNFLLCKRLIDDYLEKYQNVIVKFKVDKLHASHNFCLTDFEIRHCSQNDLDCKWQQKLTNAVSKIWTFWSLFVFNFIFLFHDFECILQINGVFAFITKVWFWILIGSGWQICHCISRYMSLNKHKTTWIYFMFFFIMSTLMQVSIFLLPLS